MSHKVIINLLDKVQKLAIKQGIDISIIYKGSSNDDGDYSWEMAKNIDTIVTNIAKYQVIAGTSFMWCNENLKNKVDYLIIDEAGQFALIDTLVVTQASKNIVF